MVSVCMATYNGEKYIYDQVKSILSQLGPDDELIISDDNSTDRTLDIIRSFNDNRIHIYVHIFNGVKQCVGDVVSANFENALMHVQGDYIFLSDQDDIWVQDKVTKMVNKLQDYSVVVSNAWILKTPDSSLCKVTLYNERSPLNNYLLRKGKYFGCCMAFRKDVLKYVLPFPNPLPLHDSWIGLLSELIGGGYFLDEPLIYYRIHGQNVSGESHNSLIFKIWYRVRLLSLVFWRVAKVKYTKQNSLSILHD